MKNFNLKKLDNVTKIIFILLVSAIVYLAVFLIIKPIFYHNKLIFIVTLYFFLNLFPLEIKKTFVYYGTLMT